MVKRLSDEDYRYVYSRVPRLCVDLLIENKKGVLLTKRLIKPYLGKWHLPGGRVYYKEGIKRAANRIAKKELGVEINLSKLLGYMEFLREGITHSVSFVFLCRIKAGDLNGSFQAEKMKYYKEIPKNMIKNHQDFVSNYLKNKLASN